MLVDEIKKLKKEIPGIITTKQGTCRFCGQMTMIDAKNTWKQDYIDEAVTEQCGCTEAKGYSFMKERKEKTRKAIKNKFQKIDPEVEELLIIIGNMIAERGIRSATIEIKGGLKAKIGITMKGLIKVERTETEKIAEEI
jgi:hypothetical protein